MFKYALGVASMVLIRTYTFTLNTLNIFKQIILLNRFAFIAETSLELS